MRHKEKRYICFDDLEIRFDWSIGQVEKFDQLWKEGYSAKGIARKFACKTIDIELLAADRFYRDKIKPRTGGMTGTKEYVPKKRECGGIGMREIKSRGYNPERKEWVYGTYLDGYIVYNNVLEYNDYLAIDVYAEVVEESVGEYTGLKDINGREIYEGDVYEYTVEHDSFSYENGHTTFETKHRAVVEFSLGTFMLGDEILGDALEYDDSLRYLGNIYENKELLEEQTT